MWMTIIVDQWIPFHGSLHLIPLLTDWHLAGFCEMLFFHTLNPPFGLIRVHSYSHVMGPTASAFTFAQMQPPFLSDLSPSAFLLLPFFSSFVLSPFFIIIFFALFCTSVLQGVCYSLHSKATTCSQGSGYESSESWVIREVSTHCTVQSPLKLHKGTTLPFLYRQALGPQ